jgi:peptide/nickel transport system permease protein
MFTVAIFAPFIATHDPYKTSLKPEDYLRPPSKVHLMGTDDLGRDVFSRMVYGARISLSVGFVAISIALLIGVTLGAISGFYGGKIDIIIMRIVEIMICFPRIYLILMVIVFWGPSIINVMVIIGLTSWAGLARMVRAEFLTQKERDYVMAARACGTSNFKIIFKHILPNAAAPIYVNATLGVGGAILIESALSFLGLGVQIPTPTWGNILNIGRHYIDYAWWLTLFPGLAILFTVLSFNLVGEGLRDILDPRLKL